MSLAAPTWAAPRVPYWVWVEDAHPPFQPAEWPGPPAPCCGWRRLSPVFPVPQVLW